MFKVLGTFIGVIGFSKILVESGIYVSSTIIHIVDREHMKKNVSKLALFYIWLCQYFIIHIILKQKTS